MTKHTWPSDEELDRLFVEFGGVVARVADHIGIPRRTFADHVRKNAALRERAQETRAAQVVADAAQELVSREEKLEQELAEAKSQLTRRRKADVFEERILDRLESGIDSARARYVAPEFKKRDAKDPHEFGLLFSDTHAAEVVSFDETLGLNEYDWPTMLRRMGRMQESVLSFQANRPYPVKRLNVWMLGDMLSGDIHEELSETNDRTLEEAAVDFGVDAARWLEEFIPHFAEIHVIGVPGNHPRRKKKPSAKRAFNNADWTAYHVARIWLRNNPSITFDIPKASFAVTTVAERWRALLMHGDGIRSTMPGVPFGGVVRRVTTLEQQFAQAGKPIDYVALGHFHITNILEGVGTRTFMNGSVKGVDEYSLKQFGSGRPPAQTLLTFHPKRGVTDVSFLDLEPTAPSAERIAHDQDRSSDRLR